jgi:hypothetical protein
VTQSPGHRTTRLPVPIGDCDCKRHIGTTALATGIGPRLRALFDSPTRPASSPGGGCPRTTPPPPRRGAPQRRDGDARRSLSIIARVVPSMSMPAMASIRRSTGIARIVGGTGGGGEAFAVHADRVRN